MLEFKAHFKSVQPDLGGSLPGNLIFGIPGKDGGYYLVAADQVDANTIRFTFTPSQKEMPAVDPVDITLPNATGAGLTTAQINALDGMFKICAYTADATNAYKAFQTAFGIGGEVEPDVPDVPDEPDAPVVTLTSISATYEGGDVAVGTAVTSLTGIVVTAHYSDGTSEAVTGYTLSGEIAEGENTITVTYQGKTATFTVTGIAESSGGEGNVVDAWTTYEWTEGIHLFGSSGESVQEQENAKYVVSEYISTENVEKVVVSEEIGGALAGYALFYFDSDKKLANPKNVGGYIKKDNANYPSPVEIIIPDNVAYFRIDTQKEHIDGTSTKFLVKYSVYLK